MSAETVPAGSTVPVARFLIQPFTARTWKETLYLLLSMPVGILTFVVMITGLTTGTALLITLIGFPIVCGHPVVDRSFAVNAATVDAFISAFSRALTIDRMVNSATITTIWKPAIMRFASTAGRQPTSPSLITKTPNGFVFVANPVPVPPSPPGA
ncbi:MAG: sensor domain-containing protein [Actinomycetota bacterium]